MYRPEFCIINVLTTYRITKLSNNEYVNSFYADVLTTYRITKLSNSISIQTAADCGFNYLQNNKTLKLPVAATY